ncbi:MAG: Bleomycin resistance protein [Planctomycetes bacterium]|nr:Bleomycin resistance protein [Planctomycetota bacterium]
MPRFNQVAPAFAARDFEGLVAFYCDVLGFEVDYKTGVYAVLARDGVQLHIYPERDGMLGGNNSAYFFVDGVDEIYEAVRERASIIHPISDQDYGLRDFLMADPEGNKIGIAQRR